MSKNAIRSIILGVLMLATLVVMFQRGKRNRELYPETDPIRDSSSASDPGFVPASAEQNQEEQEYVISLIGDCTLASHQYVDPTEHRSIEYHIQKDYSYPFTFVREFFEHDDLTVTNLECALTDVNLSSAEQFYFRAPAAYAQILTQGGVDFVTTANNHMGDFGVGREEFTYMTLEENGIPFGKEGESKLITTDSGLTVGIYCACNHLEPDGDAAVAAIRQLREDGAEYVICAFHWGKELVYTPSDFQKDLAHRCIDAGADLIYGSHSHCLQPVEEYGNGLILYSMGNWVFGGSTSPTDMDTAIIQVHVKRSSDGKVYTSGYTAIPCCVSSRPVKNNYIGDNYNDYRPTPYEEGSEGYLRVMSKLDGSFVPDAEGRDYSDVYAQYG